MFKRKFTADQLADRFIDRREIENLMGRYTSKELLCEYDEIVDLYWAKESDKPTLGVNNGYYVGLDAIRAYYAAWDANVGAKSELMRGLYPDFLRKKGDIETHGVGQMFIDALSTAVVELADDGKTAKALWYVLGVDNDITEYGPLSRWGYGYIAADFVKENGEWKVWYLLDVVDLDGLCGQDWVNDPENHYPALEEYAAAAGLALPEPTVAVTIRAPYSTDRVWTKLVEIPQPYATFADTFSYGI